MKSTSTFKGQFLLCVWPWMDTHSLYKHTHILLFIPQLGMHTQTHFTQAHNKTWCNSTGKVKAINKTMHVTSSQDQFQVCGNKQDRTYACLLQMKARCSGFTGFMWQFNFWLSVVISESLVVKMFRQFNKIIRKLKMLYIYSRLYMKNLNSESKRQR